MERASFLARQSAEVRFAFDVVSRARRLSERRTDAFPLPSLVKKGGSVVGLADYTVQAFVSSELEGYFPGDRFIAEESFDALQFSKSPGVQVKDAIASLESSKLISGVTSEELKRWIDKGYLNRTSPRKWILDPVDATREHLLGGDEYTTNLAFYEGNAVKLGVISCPEWCPSGDSYFPDQKGRIFLAIKNGGAWVTSLDPKAPFYSLTVSSRKLREGIPIRGRYFNPPVGSADEKLNSEYLRCVDPTAPEIQARASVHYLLLALGLGDFIVRLVFPSDPSYRLFSWDHAAGALIAMESGATVTDLKDKPLDFTTGERLTNNYGLIAAPPTMHADLVADCARAGALLV